MNTLNKNKSIFNYKSGEGGIDSYGVDHSGFTLRDELEYQMARTQREQELLKSYNANGITNNNLINGTSFWGNSADNNYGFGTSNISQNVENVTNQLKNSGEDIIRGSFINKSTSGYASATDSSNTENNSSVWNSMKNTFNNVLPYIPSYPIGYSIGSMQNTFNQLNNLYGAYKQYEATVAAQKYGEPSVKKALKASNWLTPISISDENKHQYVSCVGATGGPLAAIETIVGGVKKEIDDYNKKVNNPRLLKQYGGRQGVLDDATKDLKNDFKGFWRGIWSDNPEECEELLPEQYRNKRY